MLLKLHNIAGIALYKFVILFYSILF